MRTKSTDGERSGKRSITQRFDAIREAWDLMPPENTYRDPQWLKSAATAAAKAGRLPKRGSGGTVIGQLFDAGYHKALDHYAVVRVDGQQHVILEPYERACSMDDARRIAAELATLLHCDAWASMVSWHCPGSTIRITLAPKTAPETSVDHAAAASGAVRCNTTIASKSN